MKKILLSVAAVSSVLPAAKAQISFTDIADVSLTLPFQRLYIDFDGGTASTTYFADYDMYFNRLNLENTYIFPVNSWGIAGTFTTSRNTAYRYSFGASLAFSSTTIITYLEHFDNGPWNGDDASQTKYVAMRNNSDSREAWIAVRYNDAANTLTIESFAVAPGTQNMTAGQTAVPEPAETAVMMALLAGGAAVWNRRRKSLAAKAGAC